MHQVRDPSAPAVGAGGAPIQHMTPGPAEQGPVSVLDALRAVWDEPNRNMNLLFGSVIMFLIPLAGPLAAAGWFCEFHQRLLRRHPEPLPKFDFADFGHYLSRGVAPFLVQLVLLLPMILVGYFGFAITVAIAASLTAALDAPAILVGVGGVLALAMVGLGLVAGVFLNAALTRAEHCEDFKQALDLKQITAYARATWKTVIWKSIVLGFVSMGLGFIGFLACGIGLYPVVAMLSTARVHLRWQVYEDYLAKGGSPLPTKAPQALPSEGVAPYAG